MAQLIDLGKLRFVWNGDFDPNTTYELNDLVRYGANVYVYINVNASAGHTPADVEFWDRVIEGAFPDQTNKANALLQTNGTTTEWTDNPVLDSIEVLSEAIVRGDVQVTYRTVDIDTYTLENSVLTVVTTEPHLFDVGDKAVISGLSAMANGAKIITSVASPTTFTYITSGSDIPETSPEAGVATVYGNISTGGDLSVAGNTALTGTLDVTGQAVFDSHVDLNDTVTVNADTVFNTDVTIKGNLNIATHTHQILAKAILSNVATLTLSTPETGHGFDVGDLLDVVGVGAPFDGHYLPITAVTSNTVSYAVTAADLANTTTSGTASVEGHLVVDNEITVGEGATFGNTVTIAGSLLAEGKAYIGDGAEAFDLTTGQLTNAGLVVEMDGGPYAQVAIHNNDPLASTDIIVYSDNGTDTSGWMDMGITGSGFEQAEFGITGPNDAYIFYEAAEGTTGKGNIVIATGDKGTENKIILAAGGFATGVEQLTITPNQNVHVEIPTESTSPTTGALTVAGGVGIQGNLNIQGNVDIEGTIVFGGAGTTVETSNLAVTDPMVYVGTDNQADLVDLAFIGEYAESLIQPISVSITNKALASNIATLTYSQGATLVKVGDYATVSGVDATFNGTHLVTAVTATTFSFAKTNANVTSSAVSPNGSAIVDKRRRFGGIARDASDGIVKAFENATTKPTTTVDFSEAGIAMADTMAGTVNASEKIVTPYVESTSAVTASTFAGPLTVSGLSTLTGGLTTAGNVTISGRLDVQEIREDVIDGAIVSNVFTANYSTGNIFYLTAAPTANFTVNLTNAPTDNGKTISLTLVVTQGATGYIPNAFQVGGTAQTLKWSNGITPTPTSSAGKIDIFSFTLIRRADAWVVLGAGNLNY